MTQSTTHLTAEEYHKFAVRGTKNASRDPDSWLCLGHACEARVWGLEALCDLPRWPWGGRHPETQAHFAFQRGEEGAPLVQEQSSHRVQDLLSNKSLFKEGHVEPVIEDNTLRFDIRFVPQPEIDVVPEFLRHAIWIASLKEGLVAKDVRTDPELARLSPRDTYWLRRAGKAYATAAGLSLSPPQVGVLMEAYRRLVACEFFSVPEECISYSLQGAMRTPEDSKRGIHLGASPLCSLIEASPCFPHELATEARFLLEVEHILPGFSLERISPHIYTEKLLDGIRSLAPGEAYPIPLRDAAIAYLTDSLAILLDEVPPASLSQVQSDDGYLLPPLPPLNPAMRARIKGGDELVQRILNLFLLLGQLEADFDRDAAFDWLLVRERWLNASKGEPPFRWISPEVDPNAHTDSVDGAGNWTYAKAPIPGVLFQLIHLWDLGSLQFGGFLGPEKRNEAIAEGERLNERMELLAPFTD